MIIPIADRHIDKALELKSILVRDNIRVDIDTRNERMNSKIREGQMNKIPYMVILGDKEKLDMDVLKEYGEIKFLTLEDIFGY